jgi:Protein of unknown function (DUF2867)
MLPHSGVFRGIARRHAAWRTEGFGPILLSGATIMKPVEVSVPDAFGILPGAQFSDAYALSISGTSLTALAATKLAFGGAPGWINGLLRLRNALVSPFGLKAGEKTSKPFVEKAGIFPVLSETPNRVVLGLNDRHLDFRLLVDVEDIGGGTQTVTASTLVRTHNGFGRIYLAIVKPFHRIIVPAMLRQLKA